MCTGFRGGSIRRQIVALAIGPIICLVILGAISEWFLREDLESISYALPDASRIAATCSAELDARTRSITDSIFNAVVRA